MLNFTPSINAARATIVATSTIVSFVSLAGVASAQESASVEGPALRCESQSFAGRLFTGRFITESQACSLVGDAQTAKDQLSKALDEVELLSQENLALRLERDEMAERLAATGASSDEAAALADSMRLEFESCSAQRERLTQENTELVAENQALMSAGQLEGDTADGRIASLMEQVSTLSRDAAEAGSSHQAAMDTLAAQLATCENNRSALSAANTSLREELASLRQQLSDLENTTEQGAALSLTITALRKEADDLAAELQAMEIAKAADESEIQALEQTASDRSARIAELEEMLAEANAQRDEALQAAARESALASQLVAKDVEIERLKAAVDGADSGARAAAAEATAKAMRQIVIALTEGGADTGAFVRDARLVLPNTALFRSGSATLGAGAPTVIEPLAEELNRLIDEDSTGAFQFLVVGHADKNPISSDRFPSNWELSSQRAGAVVRALIEQGVDPSRLLAAGKAEFDPIEEGDSAESLAANRRIEVYAF